MSALLFNELEQTKKRLSFYMKKNEALPSEANMKWIEIFNARIEKLEIEAKNLSSGAAVAGLTTEQSAKAKLKATA